MPYEIEKGVPIPNAATGSKAKYPFADMAPGDSFLATGVPRARISSTACSYGKRHGKKFATRVEGDGVRVWRVE